MATTTYSVRHTSLRNQPLSCPTDSGKILQIGPDGFIHGLNRKQALLLLQAKSFTMPQGAEQIDFEAAAVKLFAALKAANQASEAYAKSQAKAMAAGCKAEALNSFVRELGDAPPPIEVDWMASPDDEVGAGDDAGDDAGGNEVGADDDAGDDAGGNEVGADDAGDDADDAGDGAGGNEPTFEEIMAAADEEEVIAPPGLETIAGDDPEFWATITAMPWRPRLALANLMGAEEQGEGAAARALDFLKESTVSAIRRAQEKLAIK